MPLLNYQLFIFFRKFFSLGQFTELEALRLAQFHLILHLEHRFATAVADVDVNRTMLVAVKEKPESVFLKNGWHNLVVLTSARQGKQIQSFPLVPGSLPAMRGSRWHAASVARAKSKGFMFV
jgi:hypothetical protein